MWLEIAIVMVITVVTIIIAVLMFRVVYHRISGQCTSNARLNGSTVIVTGSSAGIGKAAALDFAKRGARVILACRNLDKAGKVADEIIKSSGNSNVVVRKLDTSDLTSVRQFADGILKSEKYLHILVNNAGIAGYHVRDTTKDGLEITMATNYYGHFLLTNLLLGLLKKSAPSRIINVSSIMHRFCFKLDPEDLNFEKSSYNRFSSYNQSKLCNVLFTQELSNKLKGTGVTCNSLHPGLVASEIHIKSQALLSPFTSIAFKLLGKVIFFLYQSEFTPVFTLSLGVTCNSLHPGAVDSEINAKSQGILPALGGILFRLCAKDCTMGAQTIIYLAVAEQVAGVSGKYFVDCKEEECSKLGSHRGMAKKLWEASELDVKLQEDEMHY